MASPSPVCLNDLKKYASGIYKTRTREPKLLCYLLSKKANQAMQPRRLQTLCEKF